MVVTRQSRPQRLPRLNGPSGSVHPFLTPVDPARDECPDYLHLIVAPMDLGTVAARLAAGHYHTRSAVGAHLWFAGAFVPPVVPCGGMPYSGAALAWQQRGARRQPDC